MTLTASPREPNALIASARANVAASLRGSNARRARAVASVRRQSSIARAPCMSRVTTRRRSRDMRARCVSSHSANSAEKSGAYPGRHPPSISRNCSGLNASHATISSTSTRIVSGRMARLPLSESMAIPARRNLYACCRNEWRAFFSVWSGKNSASTTGREGRRWRSTQRYSTSAKDRLALGERRSRPASIKAAPILRTTTLIQGRLSGTLGLVASSRPRQQYGAVRWLARESLPNAPVTLLQGLIDRNVESLSCACWTDILAAPPR